MIDEEVLDELKQVVLDHPIVSRFIPPPVAMLELIQLAKLGLWARQHGIPALKDCVHVEWRNYLDEKGNVVKAMYARDFAESALSTLPKEKDE